MSNPIKKMELSIGGYSKIELLNALAKKKVALNAYATMIFMSEEFEVSERPYYFVVESISVLELGLVAGGTFAEIVDRAESRGLSLCPIEVAPYLRLQYEEPAAQSDYLTIASPAFKAEYMPNRFYLRSYDNHFWLRGYKATVDVVYEPQMKFVFRAQNA
jgi:hypothetical protein